MVRVQSEGMHCVNDGPHNYREDIECVCVCVCVCVAAMLRQGALPRRSRDDWHLSWHESTKHTLKAAEQHLHTHSHTRWHLDGLWQKFWLRWHLFLTGSACLGPTRASHLEKESGVLAVSERRKFWRCSAVGCQMMRWFWSARSALTQNTEWGDSFTIGRLKGWNQDAITVELWRSRAQEQRAKVCLPPDDSTGRFFFHIKRFILHICTFIYSQVRFIRHFTRIGLIILHEWKLWWHLSHRLT